VKRALIVGIDDYGDSSLVSCVADARALAPLLERHDDGSKNYDVALFTSADERIDRARLRSLLGDLFSNAKNMDVLFYFSGHGAETPWGAELVTQDFSEHSLGVSMNDVITLAN
jgi:hypothetical protein